LDEIGKVGVHLRTPGLRKALPAHIIAGLAEAAKPAQADRGGAVEFLNLLLIFISACLVFKRPEKERLAFGLLVASVLLPIVLFSVATRTALLPGMNY